MFSTNFSQNLLQFCAKYFFEKFKMAAKMVVKRQENMRGQTGTLRAFDMICHSHQNLFLVSGSLFSETFARITTSI